MVLWTESVRTTPEHLDRECNQAYLTALGNWVSYICNEYYFMKTAMK